MLAQPTATRPPAAPRREPTHSPCAPALATVPGPADAAVRLVAAELAEQGWRLAGGGALARFLLAHPNRGVLLLDVCGVPDCVPDPVGTLGDRLRANGFANRHGCLPPLAHRHLSLAEVLALPALVGSLPGGQPPRGEWVAEVLAAYRAPVPRRRPVRALAGLALALLLAVGLGLWISGTRNDPRVAAIGGTPTGMASVPADPAVALGTGERPVLTLPTPVSAPSPVPAVVAVPDLPQPGPVVLAVARRDGRADMARAPAAADPVCRAVLVRAQVGGRISDADRDYLRQGCGH